jgi:hypothetical protein
MYEHFLTIYEIIKYFSISILSLVSSIFRLFFILIIPIILIFTGPVVTIKVMKYYLKLLLNYAQYRLIGLSLLKIMN